MREILLLSQNKMNNFAVFLFFYRDRLRLFLIAGCCRMTSVVLAKASAIINAHCLRCDGLHVSEKKGFSDLSGARAHKTVADDSDLVGASQREGDGNCEVEEWEMV